MGKRKLSVAYTLRNGSYLFEEILFISHSFSIIYEIVLTKKYDTLLCGLLLLRCMGNKENKRIHLVNLFKWRSTLALIACLVTLFLSVGSIAYGIITDPPELVNTEFEWFTVDSNLFMAFAAMMIIPFAIEGIQKKLFTYPRWALLIHYAGVINTTLTMIFTLGFISWYNPAKAFGEENKYLHILCPFLVLLSFFLVEARHTLTRKDNFIALIPFSIYCALYVYNVVYAKNWDDHYMLNTLAPFYVSLPLVYLLIYVIGYLIRIAHNKLLRYRDSELKKIWDEELDPITVKIEIYSLGTHAGIHEEKDNISVPFDILEEVSEKFDIKLEELARAFSKGVIDGLKEKEEKKKLLEK